MARPIIIDTDPGQDDAVAILKRGIEVARERGDLMPQKAMAELLRSLGEEVAELEAQAEAPAAAVSDTSFSCTRCGRPSGKMPERPFKGELGERIHHEICANCWRP